MSEVTRVGKHLYWLVSVFGVLIITAIFGAGMLQADMANTKKEVDTKMSEKEAGLIFSENQKILKELKTNQEHLTTIAQDQAIINANIMNTVNQNAKLLERTQAEVELLKQQYIQLGGTPYNISTSAQYTPPDLSQLANPNTNLTK